MGEIKRLPDGSICYAELFDARYERVSDRGSSEDLSETDFEFKLGPTGNEKDKRIPTEKDKGRIAYSPYVQRLAGVTQILSPSLKRSWMHNRLTHSTKVAGLAREIAFDHLRRAASDDTYAEMICDIGGLDAAACEAAGLAHDIGHAPFGHAAERYLDAWLREFDDSEGFEGNAQSLRVVVRLDRNHPEIQGLDLTAVTLGAIAKYPWTRDLENPLRSKKFSAYNDDAEHLGFARQAVPSIVMIDGRSVDFRNSGIQALEASIMDISDDITYAMHDLQDFYESGLVHMPVIQDDLRNAAKVLNVAGYRLPSPEQIHFRDHSFILGAAELKEKYPAIFNLDVYIAALMRTEVWLKRAFPRPFDGTRLMQGLVRETFSDKISGTLSKLSIEKSVAEATGSFVKIDDFEWHQLQILKYIAQRYVVHTTFVAAHERAQVAILRNLLSGMLDWVLNIRFTRSLPSPLATDMLDLKDAKCDSPSLRRVIVDYVCGLTDDECRELASFLQGMELPDHSGGVLAF